MPGIVLRTPHSFSDLTALSALQERCHCSHTTAEEAEADRCGDFLRASQQVSGRARIEPGMIPEPTCVAAAPHEPSSQGSCVPLQSLFFSQDLHSTPTGVGLWS